MPDVGVSSVIQWGVAMRTLPGERESGDLHVVKSVGPGVLAGVVDGLGHGAEAGGASGCGEGWGPRPRTRGRGAAGRGCARPARAGAAAAVAAALPPSAAGH